MKMDTIIADWKENAEQHGERNLMFLRRLKMKDDRVVDRKAHRLHEEAFSIIDCTQCANCCRQMLPVLSQKDIAKFASGLKVAPSIFKETHLIPLEESPGKFEFNAQPCPFLTDNLCINYAARPQDCRSFPHLHKKEFRSRLWSVIANYEICPIVYYVYEQLKHELWHFDGIEEDPFIDAFE